MLVILLQDSRAKHDPNNNRLLTEHEGRTGKYLSKVVTVRTEHSEVRTKTTEGQYSTVRLEQARLVSSLFYYMASSASGQYAVNPVF